jgi:tetratricopeptide (TPR) repeat protein
VHIALGELDQAINILESARHDNPDHALLLARLAWCRLQQGDHDDALRLYERSLDLKPFMAVYHALMRAYRDNDQLEDLAKCLDAARQFWSKEQTDWPEAERQTHSQQLGFMQLDLWLAREQFEAAEAWLAGQREGLSEDDWCTLLSGFAERLAARDRHAEAEEWLRIGLRHYPVNLVLFSQLAELAHLQGRPRQSIALLRRSIQLAGAQDKPTVLLWIRLSANALQTYPGLAREAAEQANQEIDRLTEQASSTIDQLDEWRLRVELATADVDAQEQDYCRAEQGYQHVLEKRPEMITALQGLGQLCMQLGRIDEAVTLFERVKAIDPTRGHRALISARLAPKDPETLEQLEHLARTPSMEGSVHTGMLLQLAAAQEKCGNYDKAFALADEANTASRRLLRYDPKPHRQRCARIRHAFPKTLYEHRADCGDETTLPVFVVGMPRSGTTLVEQILASHSCIHGAGELGTIPRVIAGLERWERHTGSGRRYPDCVDDLDASVIRGIAHNILNELKEYAPAADHVVDKLPHNFENIGLIKLLFPNAKIISVRRDPRDIAVSNFFTDYAGKHAGMGFAYDLDWIGEQLADHNLLMHHWQQVFPGEILEIHYEELVADAQTSARNMLEYIGVEWESQVLDFHALQRPVKTASLWQVRQPLYASSAGRWQRYQQHLKPLIEATNRKITWCPIDMLTLPEPGWLNAGVDSYKQGDLNLAEDRFKRLLQFIPKHAAANFMLGLIYLHKGHQSDGIALMEQAVESCPWNQHWRRDLAQAYHLEGREQDACVLADSRDAQTNLPLTKRPNGEEVNIPLDYLFLSEESRCSTFESETSGTDL